MRRVNIGNSAHRNALVAIDTLKPRARPRLGLPGRAVRTRRYVAATEAGLHAQLVARFGDDYGQALVDGDPEVDIEVVGRAVGTTHAVLLTGEGEVLHASPQLVEVILGADGQEKSRREPLDREANVSGEVPVRWTGRTLPLAEAARRFAFRRTLQLRHVDGLTFDFLYAMASELASEGVVVRIGAGARGRDPLVFQLNGTPYQAFLEGRVDGEAYQLLLHLTNLELRRLPEEGEEAP